MCASACNVQGTCVCALPRLTKQSETEWKCEAWGGDEPPARGSCCVLSACKGWTLSSARLWLPIRSASSLLSRRFPGLGSYLPPGAVQTQHSWRPERLRTQEDTVRGQESPHPSFTATPTQEMHRAGTRWNTTCLLSVTAAAHRRSKVFQRNSNRKKGMMLNRGSFSFSSLESDITCFKN